jgi:ferrous iron transport protein B
VLVFLPQIVILFFILTLEDSGYLPRAAFLLDRVMGSGAVGAFVHSAAVELCLRHSGHHGHAHHHALARAAGHHLHCAAHDLLGTPAGVCAADCRLHPRAHGGGPVQPAGPGDVRALRGRHLQRHGRGGRAQALARHGAAHAAHHGAAPVPVARLRSLAQGLYERASIFIKRVGGIILALSVLLWCCPPSGAARGRH